MGKIGSTVGEGKLSSLPIYTPHQCHPQPSPPQSLHRLSYQHFTSESSLPDYFSGADYTVLISPITHFLFTSLSPTSLIFSSFLPIHFLFDFFFSFLLSFFFSPSKSFPEYISRTSEITFEFAKRSFRDADFHAQL